MMFYIHSRAKTQAACPKTFPISQINFRSPRKVEFFHPWGILKFKCAMQMRAAASGESRSLVDVNLLNHKFKSSDPHRLLKAAIKKLFCCCCWLSIYLCCEWQQNYALYSTRWSPLSFGRPLFWPRSTHYGAISIRRYLCGSSHL